MAVSGEVFPSASCGECAETAAAETSSTRTNRAGTRRMPMMNIR